MWDIVYENIILKTPGIGKLTEDQYIYRGKELRFVVDMNLVESTDLQYYMASEIASISFSGMLKAYRFMSRMHLS